MCIPKKIRVWIEMPSDDYIVDVPEWVKTVEDLEQFADDVANRDCSSGYEEVE